MMELRIWMDCGYDGSADMMSCGWYCEYEGVYRDLNYKENGSVDMMNCGYDGAADDLWMAVLIDDVLIEGRIDYSGVGEW